MEEIRINCLWNEVFTSDFSVSTIREEMPPLLASGTELVLFLHDSFSDNIEPWFMSAQAQHDQVSIGPVQTVSRVWVVAHLWSLVSDEL